MDQIYFWILILFFIILILDYTDKYFKKEHFTTNRISDSTIAPYYEENSRIYISKFKNNYIAGYDTHFISQSDVIIVCIGTPVYKNTFPKLKQFLSLIYCKSPFLFLADFE